MDKVENERCPMCQEKKMTLIEDEKEIPYFGKVFLFSMDCSKCNFHKADIESAEFREPCRIIFEANSEKDMHVRVVKSAEAHVKIPTLRMDVRPGPASNGYITNVEGILNRFEKIIQEQKEAADAEGDKAVKTTAKNLLKKIWKIKCGDMPVKIVIEDPTGNSAIISEKTVIEKLKVKK
ncbi:MAG: ZPR1 zinc finger domain-containing protein [Nanoarchaeota archaeon]|nr:ZPR1 zinc finger domain-containing protein [Nanoarchaeota archaeon]MBU4242474.1 ZPR1 zinc finger domain-containing protein [Nanoarchaeota archaeon]MBU4352003.1 ZPR1 zinc finger domain-containing protein [Nanoarchaeota archaeon]MBU4456806.1 ZPR1 zinc finger domain-containing protein [Nanoarchaeota archaeon]MCG2719388.1 ZPR1 zinc finger domain-containing protein [Nanoarchaeota archaeon]